MTDLPLTEDELDEIEARLAEYDTLASYDGERYEELQVESMLGDVQRLVTEARRQRAENAELLALLDRNGVAWPVWASERHEDAR